MKIAFASDDGQSVSQHFGHAKKYVVVSIEEGRISGSEVREKPGHIHAANTTHQEEQSAHETMISVITDCEVAVAIHMGTTMYNDLRRHGIQPTLTNIQSIDDAVKAYVEGHLEDHPEQIIRK